MYIRTLSKLSNTTTVSSTRTSPSITKTVNPNMESVMVLDRLCEVIKLPVRWDKTAIVVMNEGRVSSPSTGGTPAANERGYIILMESLHEGDYSRRVAKIRLIKKEDIPKAIKIAHEELKCVAFPSKNWG
ncbi:hypothetical protein Tco_0026383, partial [Tanacetum coccineum]